MNHFLPALTLSTFLHVPKTSYSLKKQVPTLVEAEKDFIFEEEIEPALAESLSDEQGVPALGMRVVAVTLTNNTNKTLEVKKSLKIAVGNYLKEPVDFTPPYLPQKQATAVYLMYQLLQLRLSKLPSNSSEQELASGASEKNKQPFNSIFKASSKKRDFTTELRELNLFHKSLSPGQTLTGLLLFPSASAAPLQFSLTNLPVSIRKLKN